MARARGVGLLVVEIGVWVYVCLLLADAILAPPQRWVVREEDYRVRPPVVIAERPRADFNPPDALRWLKPLGLPPPAVWPRFFSLGPSPNVWGAWQERRGMASGPLERYGTVISRPNVPWAVARIVTTIAVGGLAVGLARMFRWRLPRARGFEVELGRRGAKEAR